MSRNALNSGNEITRRIRTYTEFRKLTLAAFERRCGFSHGYVNNIRAGISDKCRSQITLAFPELNVDWVVTGKGEMLTEPPKPVTTERTRYQEMIQIRNVRIMELETLVLELQRRIDSKTPNTSSCKQ